MTQQVFEASAQELACVRTLRVSRCCNIFGVRSRFGLTQRSPRRKDQTPAQDPIDSDELIVLLKRVSARRERPLRAARDDTSVHAFISISRYLIIDRITRLTWLASGGMPGCARNNLHMVVFFNRKTPQAYFRGLPRFATINPRASAAHRSRLANLSASLRSGPGGIRRASSKASAARASKSRLSIERCVSLLIAAQSSCYLGSLEAFDNKTPI